jgi:hypothetical protein
MVVTRWPTEGAVIRSFIPAALALLLLAAPAAAQSGVLLSWDDCGSAGSVDKTFSCTTNTGQQTLVGSYVPPAGLTKVMGNIALIEIHSTQAVLPSWWEFENANTCRELSLGVSGDFTAGPSSCADYWAGQATANVVSYAIGVGGTDQSRLTLAMYRPSDSAGPVSAGTEYYSFLLNINNARTIPSTSCPGCNDPVCIVLDQIQVLQLPGTPGGDVTITAAAGKRYITWQGGTPNCSAANPVTNATWGRVKSLYR